MPTSSPPCPDLLVRAAGRLAEAPDAVTHRMRKMTLRHSDDSLAAGGTRVPIVIFRCHVVVKIVALVESSDYG